MAQQQSNYVKFMRGAKEVFDKLTKKDGNTLYYAGEDPDYRFEVECWPDNGTIKRMSVFRDDMGVEIQYISDHQDRM